MVGVEAAAHRGQLHRQLPAARRPDRRCATVDEPVPGGAAARSAARDRPRPAPGPGRRGRTRSAGASATRPYAVRLWCDTPWCRGRGSASEIRSAPTGRPPSVATALTASPTAMPEKPQRVPVPRLPGPCATIATSAPQHVPGGEQAAVDVGGLQVAAERLPDGDHAGQLRRAARRASGRTRPAAPRRRSSRTRPGRPARSARHAGEDRRQRRVQVGDDDRHPVERPSASARAARCGESSSSAAEHDRLQRRVAGLDHVPPRPGRRVRRAAGPGSPRPARIRRCRGRARARSTLSRTRSPAPGSPTSAG